MKINCFFFLMVVAVLMLFVTQSSLAQCSVCTQTTDDLDPNAAKGLNMGIIYLAMLPITIIGVIGYQFYRKSK